jgi:O-antigen ligase
MSIAATQVLRTPAREERSAGSGGVLWWLVALVAIGATLAIATYAGSEVAVLGLLLVLAFLVAVTTKPEIGVLVLMANFLVASYPSPIRGQGLLTINNILGIILSVLLVARLAQHPDLWFLRVKQVRLYVAIGLVLLISSVAASYQFPDLRVTSGRFRLLDQSLPMAQDFVTRLAFLILAMNFLTRKRDLQRAIAVMMICLVMIVPSALFGYATGQAQAGYRAAAEFSAGTNPNRLAFLCLMQIAFWWYLMRAKRKTALTVIGLGVVASLIFTIFLTASRSGIVGLGLLFYLLTRTRGGVSGGRLQVVALALLAIGVLLTVVPTENLERLQNLNPFARGTRGVGTYSTERRVATVETGWQMFEDYPVFGVGLGNFREVARQVYLDPFWRPPHNSYIWSLSEGGVFCFVLYLVLFASTWRDIRWLQASPAVPPELRWIPAALEPSLVLLLFHSAFADIWLSPITYILLTLVIVFRRYVSRRRVVLV